jgi:hypothetical protein
VNGRHLRVDSRETLARAMSPRTLARVFLPRIQITGARLHPDSIRAVQQRIDKLADACGCGEGAAAALIAPAGYFTYLATLGAWPGAFGFSWRALVAMFAGATLGKAYGLARARLELRRVLSALASSLPAVPPATHAPLHSASRHQQPAESTHFAGVQ